MSRRIRLLLAALAAAALLWLLLAAAERALALAQRFVALPGWLQGVIAIVLFFFTLLGSALTWWLLKPRRPRRAVPAPDRASLELRIGRLGERGADTSPLSGELAELDRRRLSERVYVALFGEISSGKSSLVRALAPHALAPSDVRGGTTIAVDHHDGALPDGSALVLADVPGSREAGGEVHEALAREEALRAHVVLYVCAGELSRSQAAEVQWLAGFGKPLLLVLNKADQWPAHELNQLLQRLRQQAGDCALEVLPVSAGGSERFVRHLADGHSEMVERGRTPAVAVLQQALERLGAGGAAVLEERREQAVLARLHQRTGTLETAERARAASGIVRKYARRAVVGAVAAVAPGSDLLIQGVLATGMVRELAGVYQVRVGEVQLEDFVRQARLTVRSASTIVLAIAGNALKAFPGLGTLGGGVLHAFAYAMIFDAMGRALASSLAERHTLDLEDAGNRMGELLRDPSGARLRQLATLTLDAWRERPPLQ